MGNTAQTLACHAGIEEEEKENGSFICGICMEPMSLDQKFKKKKCSHPFCLDCMSKHIYYKIQDNNAQVKCPNMGCWKLLDPLSCRSILSVETFVRWCDVICEAMVVESPNAYCPFRDCSARLALDECRSSRRAKETKVQCPSCRRLFCFKCKVPWHTDYRCGENSSRRDSEEALFSRLEEKKRWKRCPMCNTCVEVTSGCDVITCRCKNRFCYRCGAKHTPMHSLTCPLVWNQDYS